MKKYFVIAETEQGGLLVWDHDTYDEMATQAGFLRAEGMVVEAGHIKRLMVGEHMNWVCPVCDGGPGNFCNCKCP